MIILKRKNIRVVITMDTETNYEDMICCDVESYSMGVIDLEHSENFHLHDIGDRQNLIENLVFWLGKA